MKNKRQGMHALLSSESVCAADRLQRICHWNNRQFFCGIAVASRAVCLNNNDGIEVFKPQVIFIGRLPECDIYSAGLKKYYVDRGFF